MRTEINLQTFYLKADEINRIFENDNNNISAEQVIKNEIDKKANSTHNHDGVYLDSVAQKSLSDLSGFHGSELADIKANNVTKGTIYHPRVHMIGKSEGLYKIQVNTDGHVTSAKEACDKDLNVEITDMDIPTPMQTQAIEEEQFIMNDATDIVNNTTRTYVHGDVFNDAIVSGISSLDSQKSNKNHEHLPNDIKYHIPVVSNGEVTGLNIYTLDTVIHPWKKVISNNVEQVWTNGSLVIYRLHFEDITRYASSSWTDISGNNDLPSERLTGNNEQYRPPYTMASLNPTGQLMIQFSHDGFLKFRSITGANVEVSSLNAHFVYMKKQ